LHGEPVFSACFYGGAGAFFAAGAVDFKKTENFFEKPLCKLQKMGYNYR